MSKRRWLSVVGLVVILLLFVPQVRTSISAAFLFVNVSIQEGQWRPLELFTLEPIRESYNIESKSGRNILVDVYVPQRTDEKLNALVIYVPFAGGGQRDTRLVNLAESFSQLGFVVAVPWQENKQSIVSVKDIEDIIASYEFIEKHERVDKDQIGLFGISYGAGPVLIAAADERIRDKVDFIVSYAGYYSLKSAMQYVITGKYNYKEINEFLEPEMWVKEMMSENLVEYGLTPKEADQVFERSKDFESEKEFDTFIDSHKELSQAMKSLSIESFLSEIKGKIIISHSTGDRTIPYTESLKLYDSAVKSGQASLAIVNMFVHGETVRFTPSTLFNNYIPSFTAGYSFLYDILSQR